MECGVAGDATVKLPPLDPGQSRKLKPALLTAPRQAGATMLAQVFDSTCLTFTKARAGARRASG
jgi:hypothetical protein